MENFDNIDNIDNQNEINKEEYIFYTKKILEENPMLYSYQKSNNDNEDISIENFALLNRIKLKSVEWLIRTDTLTTRKKCKELKKYCRFIKKDYKKNFNKNKKSIEKIDTDVEKNLYKNSFKMYSLIYFEVLVFLFIILFIKKISFFESFVNNTLYRFVFVCFVVLLVIAIIFKFLLLYDNREKCKKTVKVKYLALLSKHKKVANKEMRIVYKYYLKNIKKNDYTFEPIGLYKTWTLKKIDKIYENFESDAIEKIQEINSKRKIFNFISNLNLIINLLIIIIFIILIINKLFNK